MIFRLNWFLYLFLPIIFDGFCCNSVEGFLTSNRISHHDYPNTMSPSKLFFHLDIDASLETIVQVIPKKDSPLASLFGPPEAKLPSETARQTATTMITIATTAAATPEFESEVLLDASHLFLDFSIFLTESKPFLKTAQVIGRILILAQDYIPDKHISPEELGIQLLMICVCISKTETGLATTPRTEPPKSTPEKH